MTIADDCSRYPLSVILAIPPAFVPVKSLRAEEVAGKDLVPLSSGSECFQYCWFPAGPDCPSGYV